MHHEKMLPIHERYFAHAAVDRLSCYSEHMENYDVETSALQRKLQSKMEALRILRKELEKSRAERDQFKLMAETLQLQFSTMRRCPDLGDYHLTDKTNVATLLHGTRERNIKLSMEVEFLKHQLGELQGDIELLRSKELRAIGKKSKSLQGTKPASTSLAENEEETAWKRERNKLISHLEDLKKKNAQLAFDLKALIDEKEEIITERDAYKCKAHRLNHELFIALRANESHPKFLDIDSIILENTYLHERLKLYEDELDLTKESMNKYKSILEAKRKKSILRLGSLSNEESILSHKQVKSILADGIDLPTKIQSGADLKVLCLTLLDGFNDKSTAFNHQKKTNKILAKKVIELEQRIQALVGLDSSTSGGNDGYSPSQILLNGYCPSAVDSSNDIIDDEATTTAAVEISCPSNGHDNAENLSSKSEDYDKGSLNGVFDDGISSLSSESERSALSSEYGIGADADAFNEFATSGDVPSFRNIPSTSTNPAKDISCRHCPLLPSSIIKERNDDLKNLPEDLAEMVQKALRELDMQEFADLHDGDEMEGIRHEKVENPI